ncbi:type II toxin-antitoxin system Phd/YefM family antitoxin [Phenylobacterium sp.]|uniref:type II toxin-antitoxin system Phd/YefM family antitoxin n=1 Tax=Phenylobacterium sp. TaxID=1871053 RepID=UPI00286A4214|nr:type II toxin-antitoxin system Phd/YefM family antitoxin [Phenylobacterium sp.]
MTWTLAKARDQFSEVVRRAVDQGPQTVSVRGKETAVVLSKAQFDAMTPTVQSRDFKAFLLSVPSLEGIDLTRDQTPSRDVEF